MLGYLRPFPGPRLPSMNNIEQSQDDNSSPVDPEHRNNLGGYDVP